MNAQETEATRQLIFAIRDLGISVVVIEHDTKFIFTLCDRVLVLVQGELLVEGSPDEVRGDPRVVEAYLGRPAGGGRGAAARVAATRAAAARSAEPQGRAHRRRDESVSFLQVRDLVVAYGAIQAVRGVSFDVEKGQIVSLIGSNGAGKTTTLRTISGLLRPVVRRGAARRRADPPAARARDPRQGRGAQPRGPQAVLPDDRGGEPAARRLHRSDEAGIREDMDRVYALFPVLGERRTNKAGLFSGGEQQMLAIGRALMSRPSVLMLDEPSMGLSPIMTQKIFSTIKELQAEGTTILLVEQNALSALALSDRGYVIDLGRTTLSGTGPRAAGRSARAGGLPGRGRRQLTVPVTVRQRGHLHRRPGARRSTAPYRSADPARRRARSRSSRYCGPCAPAVRCRSPSPRWRRGGGCS